MTQRQKNECEEIAWNNANCAADQTGEYDNEPYSSFAAYAVNVVDTCRERGLNPETAMEEYLKTCFLNALK